MFPELVLESEAGWLMVDYGALAVRLADAAEEVDDRLGELELRAAVAPRASDAELKESLRPLRRTLHHIDSDADGRITSLSDSEYTALVGALVEAVKELDRRLVRMEKLAEEPRGESA